jgi:hypothetical protein
MRFVLWYRGDDEDAKSAANVTALLPEGTHVVDSHPELGTYLVEGNEEVELKTAFPHEAGWTLAPEQFGYSI